ncbi:hypothetical protein CDL15_Pgr005769 [Punica granatum]|uniref:Carbohydrate binding domain-containing protein n=1 Tax=Punica granatum TaxID=22663 RepID=A0A218WHV4_PUNGR|nr:hypothetical protein CDL15_Pgr005769 [Punica granatum]
MVIVCTSHTGICRHRVIIKNTSQKASIRDLKLLIQNLSGSLWGLSSTRDGERNTYELPQTDDLLIVSAAGLNQNIGFPSFM